ncbi:MAG: zinc-binding dehydrogenase [Chloroflexi bacterium]|nr:zinc-binding dehydrogenase [Chloroflexota bacterium]
MPSSQNWYLTAPRVAEVFDEPMPVPGPGEVRVRIAYTAISPGSNVHLWRVGSYRTSAFEDREDLVYMGSGVVEALGEGVTSVVPGDRVVMSTGHRSHVVVPASGLHRVPDALSLRDAALSYLPSWSVSVLHLGRYQAGETVAVVGLGLVGASAALVAELNGARVLGLDIDARRRSIGAGLGLGAVADPTDAPAVAAFLGAGGASGPDLVIETTGAWGGLRTAIDLARDFTRIAVMGIYRTPPPADLATAMHGQLFGYPAKFNYKRLEIIGCGADPAAVALPAPRTATTGTNWDYVLEQAGRGRLPLGRLVTNVLPPASIGEALEGLAGGDTSMLGVVFDWGRHEEAPAGTPAGAPVGSI